MLFTPKSLARVAEAVDWEETLVVYKDGTTNMQQYMRAMAILYERWMRGWSIPDFAEQVRNAGANNWVEGLGRIYNSLQERVGQLVGFYEGLWRGANPGWHARWGWNLPAVMPAADPESGMLTRLGQFIRELHQVTDLEREEEEG